jgi:hypothetical protein
MVSGCLLRAIDNFLHVVADHYSTLTVARFPFEFTSGMGFTVAPHACVFRDSEARCFKFLQFHGCLRH